MRNLYLLLLPILLIPTYLIGQSPTGIDRSEMIPDQEATSSPLRIASPAIASASPAAATTGCTGIDSLSTASNVFSLILTESNPIVVDNSLNTVLFIHRNDATQFGGHSGNLRYDISTDGGTTWNRNNGPLNPTSVNGTNAARYPNIAIFNPSANTNPNNAYLTYQAPTVNTTWNGYVKGSRRLNGTGNTEIYNNPNTSNTLIPRGLCKGAPGKYWSIDAIFDGTNVSGYRVLEGTWNSSSSDVDWVINDSLLPPFNTALNGTPTTSDFNIAFDPSGTNGWVCILTHVTPGPAPFSLYPVFYNTTDGGQTWSGPETVDLGQLPCITSNMATGNVPTTAFDMDLVVDVNGEPHCAVTIGNGNNAYAIFYTEWHAVMDITRENGVWNAVHISDVWRGRGTYGTTNPVNLDMECQASRTEDGTKVFFTWVDADSAVAIATANLSPNLYGAGYDVVNRNWTAVKEFTSCTSDNGNILFPKMANTVLGTSGTYRLPVVYATMSNGNDPLATTTFNFLDSLCFTDAEFVSSQCTAAVSIAATDTITACGTSTLNAGTGNIFRWSTGATSQSITVTATGMYSVGVNNGCCTGSDSVYVVIDSFPVANYNSSVNSLTANFSDQSNGQVTSWFWDFGDGNTSTQANPSHTYVSPGTYLVCLTSTNNCGSDSTCGSVTVTCPPAAAAWSWTNTALTVNFSDLTVGNNLSWLWAFGDGTTSTLQNPSHTYSMPGTYSACLAITDSCGSDTLCQVVTVCAAPVAAFTSNNVNLGTYDFTDGSSPMPVTWVWDFGDGTTSMMQNPQHTYVANGLYTVCLYITDSCAADTICDTLNVIVISTDPGLNIQMETFPNPVEDQMGFRLEGAPAGPLQLRLSNALGQTIWEDHRDHTGTQLELEINMSGMAPGLYFMEVEIEGQRWVNKVLRD